MRCLIDGSDCPYQSGDDFGLLSVSANICQGCNQVVSRQNDLVEIVEQIGIKPKPEAPINEEDWGFLTENTKFLLSGLGLLRKEFSKKVPEISEETIRKLIDEDGRIISIRQFIENQEKFLESGGLDSLNLKDRIVMTIKDAEKELRNIKKRIRKEPKSIINERIGIVSELIKLIKWIRAELILENY